MRPSLVIAKRNVPSSGNVTTRDNFFLLILQTAAVEPSGLSHKRDNFFLLILQAAAVKPSGLSHKRDNFDLFFILRCQSTGNRCITPFAVALFFMAQFQ